MPLALTTQTDQSVFLLAQFDVLGEKHLESDEITFRSTMPFAVTLDLQRYCFSTILFFL